MLRLKSIDRLALARLLAGFGVDLRLVAPEQDIPGSYWGDSEAGLSGKVLYARLDTPVHSVLHEIGHYICMAPERRSGLLRDAGGTDDEECAVCYLQLCLAEALEGVGRNRLMQDMDDWGYSFRLGSTARWLSEDAASARAWLLDAGLIDASDRPTGRLRCD